MGKRLIAKKSKKAPQDAPKNRGTPKSHLTSNSSDNPDRKIKGASPNNTHLRQKSTIKRLRMYREKPNHAERTKVPDKPARIEPDRKWFGNTRTINQSELEKFRNEVREAVNNPYSMLLKHTKLPVSLFNENSERPKRPPLLNVETFEDTFGPKARRKRPKLGGYGMEDFLESITTKADSYEPEKDSNLKSTDKEYEKVREKMLEKGQSKRIWEELYKVVDSSDVIVQVIDVRDPIGTRCHHIEKQVKKQVHKHMILVLNKCDLVPTWVTTRWVKYLSASYPTLAFKASVTNPFGKSALISILRQFDKLHREKKNISIGFIGYPNVGKSSVINTLRKKAVCKVAPIPGETKVWQYITLTKRIYLIDCPGVVYNTGDDETQLVLKGVVRPERLTDASIIIPGLLERADHEKLNAIYGISDWTDADTFLEKIGRKQGRLLKGGEVDYGTVSKKVLYDWQRGKIPFFEIPPNDGEPEPDEKTEEEAKVTEEESKAPEEETSK